MCEESYRLITHQWYIVFDSKRFMYYNESRINSLYSTDGIKMTQTLETPKSRQTYYELYGDMESTS